MANAFSTNQKRSRIHRAALALSTVGLVGMLSTIGVQSAMALGAAFDPYPGITVTAGSPTVMAGSETVATITDLQVDAASSSERVPVKLTVDSGTLELASTTGLTFIPSDATTGSTIYFAGSRDDVNAALSSLKVTKESANDVTVTATIWDEAKDSICENGHFYRMVDDAESYSQAQTLSEAAFNGNGYVVTVTSEAENTCVWNNIVSKSDSGTANITWMGAIATYAAPTMTFTWDGGPEDGNAFWEKAAGATGTSGSSLNSGYAYWDVEMVSGSPLYQPNARVTGSTIQEPCVVYYKAEETDSTWHDVNCGGPNQFVIEADSPDLNSAIVVVKFAPALPNTGLSIMSIVLGIFLAGALLVAASGSFTAQGRLVFAGRRERLINLLRSADAHLRNTERRKRR